MRLFKNSVGAPRSGLMAVFGLFALAASAAGLVGTAQPASAAYTDCPSSYLCFWVNNNYSGAMGKFAGNNENWGAYAQSGCTTGNWNDCATSLYNHGTSCSVWVWENISYAADNLKFTIGQKTSGLGGGAYNFNDKISSNHWCTSR